MERAVLLMNTLNVSQKANNEFSHKGDKALDLSGKDSGIDNLKAPFTGIIKRIYASSNDGRRWYQEECMEEIFAER